MCTGHSTVSLFCSTVAMYKEPSLHELVNEQKEKEKERDKDSPARKTVKTSEERHERTFSIKNCRKEKKAPKADAS